MQHQNILNHLQMAHGQAEIEIDSNGSREMSLVKTKIEEAMYWLGRDAVAKAILIDTDDIMNP